MVRGGLRSTSPVLDLVIPDMDGVGVAQEIENTCDRAGADAPAAQLGRRR